MSIFWDNTLSIMAEKNISQVALAKCLNKNKTTINHWIKYDRIPPSDDGLKIAQALDVPLEYLITGVKQEGWKPPQRYADIVNNLKELDDTELKAIRILSQGFLKAK